MAKNTIADLDTTAANNTDVLGQSTAGAASANTIDTLFQNSLGLLARAYGDIGGLGTVGGTADAITLASLSTYQVLESGLLISFKAGAANTGAATLNLDSLGEKAIRRQGDVALSAGDIVEDGIYLIVYDEGYTASGAWVILNPGGGGLKGLNALSLVAGDILYASGADTLARLPKGTNGEFLTLSSGIPAWSSSGGGLTLVGTLTTTSGTEQIITGIPTTYKYLMAVVRGVSFASTNTLVLGVSQNNGSSYDIQADVSTALASAGDVMAGAIMIYNTGVTSTAKYIVSNVKCTGLSTTAALGIQSGATGKTNALRFRGGTFDAGAIDIYGVN